MTENVKSGPLTRRQAETLALVSRQRGSARPRRVTLYVLAKHLGCSGGAAAVVADELCRMGLLRVGAGGALEEPRNVSFV